MMIAMGRAIQTGWGPAGFYGCLQLSTQVHGLVNEFWRAETPLQLFSLTARMPYFCQQDDFFAVEVEGLPYQLRLSQSLCDQWLTGLWGPRNNFSLQTLTPLESALLSAFGQELFELMGPNEGRKVYALWVTTNGGKLLLSLPVQQFLTPSNLPQLAARPGTERFFPEVGLRLTFSAGRTKLPVEALTTLEPGDWLILNESQAGQLWVNSPHLTCHVETRHLLQIPDAAPNTLTDNTGQGRLIVDRRWEQLMVEVNADFPPFRIPLSELKQMSEGLLVELGDLLSSPIRLHSEGTPIAEGELIIVGDKFAVRLTQVFSAESSPTNQIATPVAAERATSSETSPEEETSVDAFLNDDFDEDPNREAW
jgi:flagellar motor switch/type III secretory pathway protein FliN